MMNGASSAATGDVQRATEGWALRARYARGLKSFVAVLLAILVLPIGCDRAGSPPEPTLAAPPTAQGGTGPAAARAVPRLVILISIDTLRADHLGTYGYGRLTSPMIDLFASEGTVFEDANSTAPWTLPSHASMLTGLYPMSHHVVTFSTHLASSTETLPAMLAAAGYRSAAAVSSGWLLRDRYRLTKDFDEFVFVKHPAERRSPNTQITDHAMEWIRDSGGQRLFLMLHYFDVHGNYTSEPEYEKLFVGPYDGPADGTSKQLLMSSLDPDYLEMCRARFDEAKCGFAKGGVLYRESDFVKPEFGPRDIQHLVDLYDAGIRQLDAELGRFFAFLRRESLLDESLVVIVSDHGEEFYDHGRLDHFLSTHQEILRVPLIMRGPGVPAGLRVASPVSLVDLVPTLLEFTGLPTRPDAEGLSLVPLLQGGADDAFRQRPLYGEAPGGLTYEEIVPGMIPLILSIRRDRWKLVHDSKRDAYFLYDLESDPAAVIDVSSEHPAIVARLAGEMTTRYEGFTPSALENAKVDLSDEEIEELRALGYVP